MHPIKLRIVDLPLPDGPAMEAKSPSRIAMDTPLRACTSVLPRGYTLCTSRSRVAVSLTSISSIASAIVPQVQKENETLSPKPTETTFSPETRSTLLSSSVRVVSSSITRVSAMPR